MNVGIDQTWHQRGVAEVQNLRIGGMLDSRADLNDARALHQDFPGAEYLAGVDFQKTGSVQDDRRSWRSGLREKRCGE